MTLEVSYHREATAELRADVSWYEDRGAGLGDRLEASIDLAIDAVLDSPESGPVCPGWGSIPVVRSRRVPDFPYRLVYLLLPDELVVVAIAHEKRKPGYWRDRVPSA